VCWLTGLEHRSEVESDLEKDEVAISMHITRDKIEMLEIKTYLGIIRRQLQSLPIPTNQTVQLPHPTLRSQPPSRLLGRLT
jgi:hypothetical protein